jgi:hypothetical protein
MRAPPRQGVLLPDVESELLCAAHRLLDNDHKRMRQLRAGALAIAIALLLTPPSAAALTVSPSTPSTGSQLTARGI